jgi:hypothetical protein
VPEPTATTVASIPFFWPFSGIRIPPLDFVSAAIRYKILENKYFWQLKLIFIHTNQPMAKVEGLQYGRVDSEFALLLIKTIIYINLRHNKVPFPKDIDNQII